MATSSPKRRTRDPRKTRRAIAEALLSLLPEDGRATADAIAERAGVSRRSVFVHFADLDELYVEAGHIQAERLRDAVEPIDPDLPLPGRVDLFTARLERIYEIMTPVRRVGLGAKSPIVEQQIATGDAWIRRMLEEVFPAELAERGPEFTDIVEAATSWGAWFQLRRLEPDVRRRRFAALLAALLDHPA